MKKILTGSVILLTSLALIEVLFRLFHPPLPPEKEDPLFVYQYLDIHRPFFRKTPGDGEYIYTPQRSFLGQKDEDNHEFRLPKDPDTIRIFILGGSVAFEWKTEKELAAELKRFIPDKRFEVINCGRGAYDSYRVLLVAQEIISYAPDLLILLSGNNEYYPNSGKSGFYPIIYHINSFFRRSWIYRISQDNISALLERTASSSNLERAEQTRLLNYRKNLKKIIRLARAADIPMLICTLPYNIKDYPPDTYRPEDRDFLKGLLLLEKDDLSGALKSFQAHTENNRDNALGMYFMGKIYSMTGDHFNANKYFLLALSSSELYRTAYRASPAINSIIREISEEEGRRVVLVDIEGIMLETTPDGLIGKEQLYDSCHLWPDYYRLVERAVIKKLFSEDILHSKMKHLKADLEIQGPLNPQNGYKTFTERGKNPVEVQRIMNMGMHRAAVADGQHISEYAIACMETAYSMAPDSLSGIEKLKPAFTASRGMSDPDKGWSRILCHAGETMRRLRKYDDSIRYFGQAISSDNRYPMPYIGRAIAYYLSGDIELADKDLYCAQRTMTAEAPLIKTYMDILMHPDITN